MFYLKLFRDFFRVGIVSFGGGNAALPLFENMLIGTWITKKQFYDILAISQATPGPFSINAATYVGFIATPSPFLGAAVATLGLAIPGFVVCIIAGKFFRAFQETKAIQSIFNGLRPAAAALILWAGLRIIQDELWPGVPLSRIIFNLSRTNPVALIIFALSIVLSKFTKIPLPALIVIAAALAVAASYVPHVRF